MYRLYSFDNNEVGDTIKEQTEYRIVFESCSPTQEDLKKYKDILRMADDKAGFINLGNYVGNIVLFGREFTVESKKISNNRFNSMLIDITERIADLPFDFNTPVTLPYDRSVYINRNILYHNFIYLKHIMLDNYDDNVEGHFRRIFYNPQRKFENEKVNRNIDSISSVSPGNIIDMLYKSDFLANIPQSNPLAKTAFGRTLKKNGDYYYPSSMGENVIVNSFDTQENRFIKYFLMFCMDIVTSFEDYLYSKQSRLNFDGLIADCLNIKEIINGILNNNIFNDVGKLTIIPAYSTVLQKREGYREIYREYLRLNLVNNYAIDDRNFERLIESKDIALLYEIWTYFMTVDSVSSVLRAMPSKAIVEAVTDVDCNIKHEVKVEFLYDNRNIKIYYNKSYTKYVQSYSLTFRPDISIEFDDRVFIFDAKFKLDKKMTTEDGNMVSFKPEDIYKMHTYKDAIKNCVLACILYPNDTAEKEDFFVDKGKGASYGVGAIPLVPGRRRDELEKFLRERVFDII